MTVETWKEKVAFARKYRDDSLESVDKWFPAPEQSNHWGKLPDPLPRNVTEIPKTLLDPTDYQIVETDPLQLAKQIAEKKYTAVQVAGAYLRAAVIGHRLCNIASEFLAERAFHRAKYLDEYLEKTGKPVGPFHGLPISVKEIVGFKGHTQTRSITAHADHYAEEDSLILTILEGAGANFHIRTTNPQTYMCIEGQSQLYGTTTNPFNTDLTSGGSSSGEAASLGLHSSSIGIGTDIGGSIRWPAAIQGQWGFKPTSGRLPETGLWAFMNGCKSIPASLGPMTRSLESTTLFTKVVVDAEPWRVDPTLNGIPWNSNPLKGKSKIKIGIMTDDGVVTPHPPIQRAIKQVWDKLAKCPKIEDYEIEVVPFKPLDHDRAWSIIMGLYYEDGGEHIKSCLAETGEPLLPLVEWIMSQPETKRLDIRELWERNRVKDEYRTQYQKYWNESGVDVVICPSGPSAASPHGTSKYWAYVAQWNLLDYPGLVFPVTAVDPAVDKVDAEYSPKNEKDKFNYELYDPEVFRDAPISLQLVGQRSDDEKVLEVMRLIEQAL